MRFTLRRLLVAFGIIVTVLGVTAQIAGATAYYIVERDTKTVCASGADDDGSNLVKITFVDSCLNAA